jgi:hypothetical protein
VAGATGYWIYQADSFQSGQPINWTRLPYELPQGWNGTLAAGVYSITAANGTLESPKSNIIALLPPAGAAKATGTVIPGSGKLNPASWIPEWLRAAPSTTHLAILEQTA